VVEKSCRRRKGCIGLLVRAQLRKTSTGANNHPRRDGAIATPQTWIQKQNQRPGAELSRSLKPRLSNAAVIMGVPEPCPQGPAEGAKPTAETYPEVGIRPVRTKLEGGLRISPQGKPWSERQCGNQGPHFAPTPPPPLPGLRDDQSGKSHQGKLLPARGPVKRRIARAFGENSEW